jgi:hypothetical protein
MARYLVVVVKMAEDAHGPDDVSVRPECGGVIPCETTREVAAAVQGVQQRERTAIDAQEADWAVYEMVSGRYVRRAITFVQDVVVS